MAPPASVIDDVPILTTTRITFARSSPAQSSPSAGFVLEGEAGDMDEIPLARAGSGEGPIDTEPLQPMLGEGERFRVGEVGQGHGPFRRPAPHDEPAVG